MRRHRYLDAEFPFPSPKGVRSADFVMTSGSYKVNEARLDFRTWFWGSFSVQIIRIVGLFAQSQNIIKPLMRSTMLGDAREKLFLAAESVEYRFAWK